MTNLIEKLAKMKTLVETIGEEKYDNQTPHEYISELDAHGGALDELIMDARDCVAARNTRINPQQAMEFVEWVCRMKVYPSSDMDDNWLSDATMTCNGIIRKANQIQGTEPLAYSCDEVGAPDEEDEEDEEEEGYLRHEDDFEIRFKCEGSALRCATKDNPRNLPCPTCGEPNRLTPEDKALGYQCDSCADRAERGGY